MPTRDNIVAIREHGLGAKKNRSEVHALGHGFAPSKLVVVLPLLAVAILDFHFDQRDNQGDAQEDG